MKFNKEAVQMGGNYLDEGVHLISFDDIARKTTQSGKEMWVLTLKDAKGATTRKNILDNDYKFDNGKTALETDIERMLYSISDAGFAIPDVDFTFDNIDQFLQSKPYKAYIRVRPQKNNPQYNEAIFITKEQFEKESDSLESPESKDDNPFTANKNDNPFAASGNTAIDIKDEDIPF